MNKTEDFLDDADETLDIMVAQGKATKVDENVELDEGVEVEHLTQMKFCFSFLCRLVQSQFCKYQLRLLRTLMRSSCQNQVEICENLVNRC